VIGGGGGGERQIFVFILVVPKGLLSVPKMTLKFPMCSPRKRYKMEGHIDGYLQTQSKFEVA
jgi:hypothetical protein